MKILNYIPVILCSIALCSCSDADKNVAFGLDSDAIKACLLYTSPSPRDS